MHNDSLIPVGRFGWRPCIR